MGKWEASSVTDNDIRELKSVGYLSANIAHRALEANQVVPTPKPGKRVVFVPHFIRGLGFPLHPFVRGLMFFYGLDFHDLPPNSFMHISAFIIVCEAFLRIQPHFGLWLKVFNVKPKTVAGEHADCGGAVISKLPRVEWPDGTFIDTVKIWQKEWFYITEPRSADWVAPVEFRSGPPARLTSWLKKGLDWGSAVEVKSLQKRISSMIEAKIELVNVIQVMLHRRLLPCQHRASPMWAHRLEDPATVSQFFRTTHEKLWKVLFKPQKSWPAEEEDTGLDAETPPTKV
jgi:hypothetical protein